MSRLVKIWVCGLGLGAVDPVLWSLLLYKAAFVALVLAALDLWPAYSTLAHQVHLHWPESGSENWQSPFASWDAAHYLHLAQEWYSAGDKSCAFYPLWPLCIRLTGPLVGNNLFYAGLILVNLLSVAGLWLFFQMAAKVHGREIAGVSLALLLASPGALFFNFIYSESLFFLLTMVFFHGLLDRRVGLVCVSGFFLPMTRAVGIFALLPLGWDLIERALVEWKEGCSTASGARPARHFLGRLVRQKLLFGALGVVAGYGTYLGTMYSFTGNPFEGFEAQRNFPNRPSINNILNIPGFVQAFANIGGLHGMRDSAVDRTLFVVFLSTLPAMWRLDRRYLFYALGTGLVPAMSNWFVSYNRFLSMCFPVFIVLGCWLSGRERRWMLAYYVAIWGALQLLLLIRHINFFWAG